MTLFWTNLAAALLFAVLGLEPGTAGSRVSAAGPAVVARQGGAPGMPAGPGPPDTTPGPPGAAPGGGPDAPEGDGDDAAAGPGDTAAADAAAAAVVGACDASTFSTILPANASVEKVAQVAAGGSYGDGAIDLNYPTSPTNLPALCAVTIHVITSNSSAYRFGLFLPTGDESGSTPWNGRFLAVGNGGFGGGINWLDMGAGVQYGFAVVSTDTGHNSTSADLQWALNEPEQREDWGWRALHGSVALGKQLAAAFYSTPSAYSYYSGCSTGGRQGLKEVQVDPAAFDGVLVGASAWDVNHLNPWVTKVGTYNLPLNASYSLNVAQFPSMAAEVIRQCDALDGVQDGIVSAPRNCTPDYSTLACGGAGTNNTVGGVGSGGTDNNAADGLLCLNAGQMATAAAAYADYMSSPTDGSAPTLLYPGLDPGCEAQWYAVLSQPETSPYGIGYIRYFVYNDASWSWTQYSDAVIADAERTDPGHPTADDYDLSAFRDRGGRLVMYHGLADGLVPPRGSELYYTRVAQNMTTDGSTIGLVEWFRYFEVPGMQHCLSTAVNAPWAFGGGSQASVLGTGTYSVPGFVDAQHDILLATMAWVENGTAVDSVIATTWTSVANASTPVLRQRPLCPYPLVARYAGLGDVNDAQSWVCGYADQSLFPPLPPHGDVIPPGSPFEGPDVSTGGRPSGSVVGAENAGLKGQVIPAMSSLFGLVLLFSILQPLATAFG